MEDHKRNNNITTTHYKADGNIIITNTAVYCEWGFKVVQCI